MAPGSASQWQAGPGSVQSSNRKCDRNRSRLIGSGPVSHKAHRRCRAEISGDLVSLGRTGLRSEGQPNLAKL
jgi:hypothetical protein